MLYSVYIYPLTERQRLGYDHLLTSLGSLARVLQPGHNDRGPPFQLVIQATIYQPVLGIKHRFSVFLGESITH